MLEQHTDPSKAPEGLLELVEKFSEASEGNTGDIICGAALTMIDNVVENETELNQVHLLNAVAEFLGKSIKNYSPKDDTGECQDCDNCEDKACIDKGK